MGKRLTLLWLLITLLASSYIRADFISLSGAETAPNIAEVEILSHSLRVTLEISAADADAFWPGITPSESIYEIARFAQTHKEIAFEVHSPKGRIIPSNTSVRIAQRKPRYSPFAGKVDPRTGLHLPELPSDKTILLATLEFPIQELKNLKLHPPLDNDGIASATIGFTSQHGRTPVSGFHYLSRIESLKIDREDPWNTRFENQDINPHNRYPLRSFLYVEPRQVRHEILLRPRDLLQWTAQPFDAWQTLTREKRAFLQRTTEGFLQNKNPTTIDQELSIPISTEILFLKANNIGFTTVKNDEQIEIGSLLIGYREKFSIKELPQSVTVDWKLFTETINSVPTLIQDPAGPFPTHVVPDFPDIQWRNYLYDYRAPNSDPVPVKTPNAVIPMAVLFSFCFAVFFILTLRSKKMETKNKHPILFYSVVIICAVPIYYALPGELRIPLPGTINTKALEEITETLLIRLSAAYEEPENEELKLQLANLVSRDNFDKTLSNLSQVYQPQTSTGNQGSVKSIGDLEVEYADQTFENGSKTFRIIGKWRSITEDYSWGHMEQLPRETRASIEITQSDNYWKISAFTPLSIR
ncbi:hypothetical protein [uncultured Microbulbifer sp.]|uniref:hypothetical protein n=1 Tax=uncultured Microbulbifer sp. TaxID=348147 RepID=UPI00261F5C3A|nr:hypothetical protein [uncultured Microbulbifer sp.]